MSGGGQFMIIKWRDEFSCYDKTIDEQHKKLIDLINEINDLTQYDDHIDRYDNIVEVFNELIEYSKYHFSHEEALFEEHGYDTFNTKVQIGQHKSFVDQVSAIDLNDLDENQSETLESILDFLSTWLEQHILGIDKKFGDFLREKHEKQL